VMVSLSFDFAVAVAMPTFFDVLVDAFSTGFDVAEAVFVAAGFAAVLFGAALLGDLAAFVTGCTRRAGAAEVFFAALAGAGFFATFAAGAAFFGAGFFAFAAPGLFLEVAMLSTLGPSAVACYSLSAFHRQPFPPLVRKPLPSYRTVKIGHAAKIAA
jgi:hypothetical protein